VFRQLVLARIIEPSSKLDAARVLEEIGIQPCSYPTLERRLPVYARRSWRQALAAALRGARGPERREPGALRRLHALLRNLARGIATSPFPMAHAARRKPRTWPTTKSGPWGCNALSWREASAQLLRLRRKGTKRNEG
jgi:hypothetical protein